MIKYSSAGGILIGASWCMEVCRMRTKGSACQFNLGEELSHTFIECVSFKWPVNLSSEWKQCYDGVHVCFRDSSIPVANFVNTCD